MLLQATDIRVRHHESHPPVLAGVSLELAAGELLAVVGANGSGKSTLARALTGLVSLEAGTVGGRTAAGGAPRVGLVLQDPASQFVAATVADDVAFGPEGAGIDPAVIRQVVPALVEEVGLAAQAARDPAFLSGGQQQRAAIAAILACDVDVLVLDEPTAMLDAAGRAAFRAQARALIGGRGAIWITQDADEVATCDRVLVLEAGIVAWTGTVRAYIAAPHVARSFGLALPAAARIAHELADRGAWPSGVAIPLDVAELDAAIAGAHGA